MRLFRKKEIEVASGSYTPVQQFTQTELDSIDPASAKIVLAAIARNLKNGNVPDGAFRSFVAESIPSTFKIYSTIRPLPVGGQGKMG